MQSQNLDFEPVRIYYKANFDHTIHFFGNLCKRFLASSSPDIDMIPRRDMDLGLEDFLRRAEEEKEGEGVNPEFPCHDGKCAFVVPTYEIDSNDPAKIPANKSQLVEQLRVRPLSS